MDSEEAMRQRDSVHLTHDQVQVVPQDRASDLAADDGLFDDHLRIVLSRGLHRTPKILAARHLADAE
jgi:hypothetical protein